MKRWYVINTQMRGEEKAVFHLKSQGFDVFLPRYRKQRRHARKIDSVLRPLFSGYVFVSLDVDNKQWRSINGTVGVKSIFCHGETPTPVPQGIIEEIMSREVGDGSVSLTPKTYAIGDPLLITEGAFADYVGLFDQMADENRVFMLLNIMGRPVRITTPIEFLAAAS